MTTPSAYQPSASEPQSVRLRRQAIFDRNLNVVGYELLYRSPSQEQGALDGDRASTTTILDAFFEIGIEQVVGYGRAFLNLTRSFLTNQIPLPLAPEKVVLEILEDTPVDSALLQGLRALRARGFTLALDDYTFEPHWEPVLPLVQIVKVDVLGIDREGLAAGFKRLRRRSGLKLLAEKVETPQAYDELDALGFDYFQGYFFARPNLVKGRRLRASHAVLLKLIARLNDAAASANEIETLISQDAGLSFKILRYINSAAIGLPREITSIRQALIYLGTERIRAWANLLILSGINDKPVELLQVGLMRAYLCEGLARVCPDANPDTAYTVGLFSILDAVTDQSFDALLEQLPLPREIHDALCHRSGKYGRLLACSMAVDEGYGEATHCTGHPEARLRDLYYRSLEKASAALDHLG